VNSTISVISPDYYEERMKHAEIIKEAYVSDWNYIYSFATAKTNSDGKKINDDVTACKMADSVMHFSIKYKEDPKIVARKIWKETWYNQWARSYVMDSVGRYVKDSKGNIIPLAWGLAQINLGANAGVVELIDGGRWKGKIGNKTDLESLIWNIDINIECGCYILSNYMHDYGTYETALTAYWAGQNSTEFRQLKWKGVKNQYIDEILNPALIEYNAALYHNWRYTNRRDWRTETNVFAAFPFSREELLAYSEYKASQR
jgi:hypothetical protein